MAPKPLAVPMMVPYTSHRPASRKSNCSRRYLDLRKLKFKSSRLVQVQIKDQPSNTVKLIFQEYFPPICSSSPTIDIRFKINDR